jgi:hypothetical protein
MKKQPLFPCAFSYMLMDFKEMIENDPPAEKIAEKLFKLKEDAKINPELNLRQREAIISRCDNYLNGTYGKTKTEENLSHSKPSKKVA